MTDRKSIIIEFKKARDLGIDRIANQLYDYAEISERYPGTIITRTDLKRKRIIGELNGKNGNKTYCVVRKISNDRKYKIESTQLPKGKSLEKFVKKLITLSLQSPS